MSADEDHVKLARALLDQEGSTPLTIIKEVRAQFKCGLAEAKQAYDQACERKHPGHLAARAAFIRELEAYFDKGDPGEDG